MAQYKSAFEHMAEQLEGCREVDDYDTQGGKKITVHQQRTIKSMLQRGATGLEISEATGLSTTAVSIHRRALGLGIKDRGNESW